MLQETHGGTVSTSFGDAFLTAIEVRITNCFSLFSMPDDLVGAQHSTTGSCMVSWIHFSCILVCCMYGGSLSFQPLPFLVNIIVHTEGCGAGMWEA